MCSTGREMVLPIDSLPNKIHANISLHLKLTLKFNMLIYVSQGKHIHVLVSGRECVNVNHGIQAAEKGSK